MTADAPAWGPHPGEWALGARDVHAYRVLLGNHAPRTGMLLSLLSADERQRAGEFGTDALRDRFVLSRGILRELLSRYLGMPAAEIVLDYGSHGKPGLHRDTDSRITFNLSHSGNVALYALAWDRAIGVDVECRGRGVAHEKVSRRFFAEAERVDLAALPADQVRRGFFNCWTRKEAYLKARGRGLSVSLSGFAVALTPGEPAVLRWVADEPEAPDQWRLRVLDPGEGYVAAVCVEGDGWRLRCMEWEG